MEAYPGDTNKESMMDKEKFINIIGKYPKNPLGEPPNGLTFTEMISDINALAAAVEQSQTELAEARRTLQVNTSLRCEITENHALIQKQKAELARYEKEEVTHIELANMQKRMDELEILQDENADLRKQLVEANELYGIAEEARVHFMEQLVEAQAENKRLRHKRDFTPDASRDK